MGHDQLFKELLQAHFRGFMELFFPDVAARLDFATLRFLDKELFTDVPEGSLRTADLVAALGTLEGAPELVLVHVEVQARPDHDFARRMYEYSCLLRLRYRAPIFSVVVYLQGGRGLGVEAYRERLFTFEGLRFRYASVALAKLDPEEYLEENPVGAALAALMSRERVRDPLELRAAMLKRIAESSLDEARKFLLVNVVETYFELDEEKRERFRQLLSRRGYREVEEMEATWADKMMEKGRQEGREEGRQEGRREGRKEGREYGLKEGLIEGKRETLFRLLETKFGPLPEHTRSRIQSLASVEELDRCLERVLTARSLDEMGLGA